MALPPTTGAPLNLFIPAFDYGVNPGDDTWNTPANDNWTALNTFAATVALLNPTVSQTIAQPAGTYLNINSLQAYGATPVIRFGVAVNVWDTALSRTAAGTLSFDTNTVGNGSGTAIGSVFNAKTGFQVNGAAPNNYILLGNGTEFIPSATLPAGIAFYQTVQQAAASLAQRGKINFLAPLTAVDDAGNGSSDVGLAASGVTAGSYTLSSVTVDTYGRVTAAASGGGITATPGGDLGPAGANTRTIGGGPYQNTSLSPIMIEGYLVTTAGGATGVCSITRGATTGLETTPFSSQVDGTQANANFHFSILIPASWKYQLSASGTANFTMGEWFETVLS